MYENIKGQLNQALSEGTLEIVFQPQYTHRNNMFYITGCEALVRLRTANGVISPDVFIPIAEDSGMISRLGLYVLEGALIQLRKWLDEGIVDDTFIMSVNISAIHLSERTVISDICNIIHKSTIDHKQICIEITESSFIDNININVLNRLSDQGINISIDDFGTGYSSLARLKFLPIDDIKIDKMFINDIASSSDDIAVVTALNQLFAALDLGCIVEGVESNEQLFILIGIGFTRFQGFFFSKPWDGDTIGETIILANF